MKPKGILVYFILCFWNLGIYSQERADVQEWKNETFPIPALSESFKHHQGSNDLLLDLSSNGSGSGSPAEEIALFLSNDAIFGTIVASLILIQAVVLFLMGQPLISRTGKIKIWEGDIYGPENSQQIFDWYTFTHVLHGFIFYGIGTGTAYLLPSTDIGVKGFYILALLLEVLWEAIENSPPVISRYRQTALANGYTGDSILNSVMDTFAMSAGFWIAYLLPPLAVVGLAVAEEIILAIAIRDNLTLNVIQLLHPFESISKWQANGSSSSPTETQQPATQE